MSKTAKIVLWIVVIVLVAGGIWWWVYRATDTDGYASSSSNNNGWGSPSTASGTSATSSALPQGDSDQSINQEMTDVNAQMNGLSSDTANVNQSMNDQPVQQAQ